ncbi:C-X-C motif chemokine 16 [Lithobates pipiens]
MWNQPLVPLFLALVLIPDPGVSQFGAQGGRCKDCRNPGDPTKFTEEMRKKVHGFDNCAHTKTVRFKLENGIFCANKDQTWVKELIACLEDKKCKEDTSSSSQKEFSKGTNEKPSIMTTKAPTTAPVTSMRPSTQSLDQNIGQSTEPTVPTEPTEPAAPSDLNTTPLDSNKANINLAQGKDKSIEPQDAGDPHSKMKQMQTAVISLIVIVLFLVAVGVGVYCRMKKANKFGPPCGSRPMMYTAAPSEDSVIEVNAG